MRRIVYLNKVYKKDLRFGDLVIIFTENSEYYVYVLGTGYYLVIGGWFDQKMLSPVEVGIRGCTFGGNIIKTDIIAALQLHLEFSNGLCTSAIQRVGVYRGNALN